MIPVMSLLRKKKGRNGSEASLFMSLSACTIAVCFQILYNLYLVKIKDWSALMDTAGAVAIASSILVVVTIMLNALLLMLSRNNSAL